MRFDANKVILTGRIDKMESVKTKQNKSAVNLLISTENKYVDVTQAQAYGLLAQAIEQQFKVGSSIIILGRLRSVRSRDSEKSSNWVVIEKIAKEIVVEYDENDQWNAGPDRV
jgi:single-stranded DNA-binding protein